MLRWKCKKKQGKPRSKWGNQRKNVYEKAGIALQEVVRKRRDRQRVENKCCGQIARRTKIGKASCDQEINYNKKNDMVHIPWVSRYLERKIDIKTVARFRCDNNEERVKRFRT